MYILGVKPRIIFIVFCLSLFLLLFIFNEELQFKGAEFFHDLQDIANIL